MYIYICVYIYIYMYIYIHVYINVYIHTSFQSESTTLSPIFFQRTCQGLWSLGRLCGAAGENSAHGLGRYDWSLHRAGKTMGKP